MKKILLALVFLSVTTIVYSQKSRGYDAQSYLRDYQTNGDIKSLSKAKENIDSASVNPTTKKDPFIQATKGEIYIALYEVDKNETNKVFSNITDEQKRALAVFENTPTANLHIAYEALKKLKELDVKGKYKDELKKTNEISTYLDNSGRANLNAQKYSDALKEFEVAYEINNTDTTLLYLCAVSADYAGNNNKTIKYYSIMCSVNKSKANDFLSLSNAYFAQKDTSKALETLSNGRKKFPDDINLAIVEANYFIKEKRGEEILDDINTLIIKHPNNINLLLIKGSIHDNITSKIKNETKDASMQTKYDSNIALAESSYQKVIALEPDNFFALFNLGILYYNKGVVINNDAAEITDKKKYIEQSSKANLEFERAYPLLEKAFKTQPYDKQIKQLLNQIYAILKMHDKVRK